MFDSFHDFAKNVRPALDKAFSRELVQLLDTGVPGPHDWLQGLNGGKKIRGLLLCLVARTLGASLEKALPRAVAVELIQTATLIHDDYIDGHRTRRSLPALWTLDGPRRAVLLGDVLFSSAIFLLSGMGSLDCGIGSRTIARLALGAWQEPLDKRALLSAINSRQADYELIISLKTGVLFAAASELGAVAAGVDASSLGPWRGYGMKVGEAYQLADDLHEMERSFDRRDVSMEALTDLAPALLYFVPDSGQVIEQALRREKPLSILEIRPFLSQAIGLMKRERERRLRAAAAELDDVRGEPQLMDLVRRAPLDLIGMFDRSISMAGQCRG
ncbi:MAG: polyprenyl synthetase family protein [Syntrophotaleaceae bacterium]